MPTRIHERPEKILIAMFHLSGGTTRPLKYEDIVVKAFKMFPDEFALRGYPDYPDSSDIHKPLYGPLKRRGLVRAAHKTFALTPSGVEASSVLANGNGLHLDESRSTDRIARDVEAEIKRMLDSAALRLFLEGNRERILDTDFYSFLGCTVRTPRNDFLGRLASSENALVEAQRLSYPTARVSAQLKELWAYLSAMFRPQIERRKEAK